MNTICHLILLSPCFASLFWGVTLLIEWKRNLKPQNVWVVFMFVMAASSLVWATYLTDVANAHAYNYWLDVIDGMLTLFVFPFIFIYFNVLTRPRASRRQYLWFVPGLAVGGISAMLYLSIGSERAIAFMTGFAEDMLRFNHPIGTGEWWLVIVSGYAYTIILFLQSIIGMTYSTLNLVRYRRGLSSFFSNLDEKSIENSRAVLIGVYVSLAASLIAVCAWSIDFRLYFYLRYVLFGSVGAAIYYMGLHVSRLKYVADQSVLEPDGTDDNEWIAPADLNDAFAKLLPEFSRLIDEQRIYLQKNLTLNDLAGMLNTNRTYVSRIINEQYACSFYDFINGKRVGHAKALILGNEILAQKEIADLSGFTSVTTFGRVFKRETGLTFNEWKKGQ